MISTRIRMAAVMPLLVLVCVSLWAARSVAATARNVPTETEAWYHASPTDPGEDDPSCALPTGCAPQPGVPVNPYPEDTLQVGVAAGRDTARTFVTLDLGGLPDGALISGGTLTLPVLADSESGSLQPESAQVSACPVSGAVEEAQGGQPDDQPEFACTTAGEGTYNEGAEGQAPTITVDLAPIAALLTTGSIAIVPAEEAHESGGTWRVAFPTRDNESADAAITATLEYQEAPSYDAGLPGQTRADTGGRPSGDLGATSTGGDFQPAPSSGIAPPDFEPAPAAAPPAPGAPEQPLAAPAAPATPVAAVGYAYPAVWLAPLVLAAVAGALARTLSGEIVLPEPGDDPAAPEPGLLDRLVAAVRPPASSRSSVPAA
jgi:hypothetical protein